MLSMRSLLKECSGCPRLLALVAAALCGAVLASPAKADYNYNFTMGDSVLSAYPTPYGHISVSLNLTDPTHPATVTFETNLLAAPYYLTDTAAVAFNVNAASWSITGLTFDCAGGSCSFTDGGSVVTRLSAPLTIASIPVVARPAPGRQILRLH